VDTPGISDLVVSGIGAFALVTAAELGDKSQIVILALVGRFRDARAVLLGAMAAFAVLNLLAVTVGAAVALAVPTFVVRLVAATLFVVFGVTAVLRADRHHGIDDLAPSGENAFVVTATMILAAELGDKTQLTVATLASASSPVAVWVGATLALAATSGLAVLVGELVAKRVSRETFSRIAGWTFLLFAIAMVAIPV
jgi:putative Ca2+/H+ antiporter (TMEM165/GDT1 family)